MGPGWLLNAGAKNEMGTVLGQGQTVNSMTIISNTIRLIKTQQFMVALYSSFQKNCNASSVQCYCATNIILFKKWIILFQTQVFTLTWPYSLFTAPKTPQNCKFYWIFEKWGQSMFENISILKNWKKLEALIKWHIFGPT